MWHFDKCKLRRACDVQSVASHSQNMQATNKGSDQTARMHRLIGRFAGRTYHIAGNLMMHRQTYVTVRI